MARKKKLAARGMTLVEVSIVVVMIGVLATLAVVGFNRYRRSARMAEATQLVTSIRSEQEAYKTERGLYWQASNSQTSYYPAPSPGAFATQWGGPCATCIAADAWTKLNIHPEKPVMYGYATIAGVGAEIGPHVNAPGPPKPTTNSSASSSSSSGESSSTNDCATINPTDPYYLVQASGDTNGDGISSTVLALSCSNVLVITNEGE